MKKIRTRYAPSPTGMLHIGGARTALFAYLYAKHFNGDFILRIEDTDVARNVEGGEESQINNLKWLGIIPDESPINPVEKYGPYRQSEKLDRYNELIDSLLNNNLAYIAYDTPEELQAQKDEQKASGIYSFRYDRSWLKISDQEKATRNEAKAYAIRFSLPKNKVYQWKDIVRGKIEFNTDDIGDFVIKKQDGYPTYNFSVVVDDHDMKISHVLRGEEHITNTPKQLALYDALKWESPEFGHLTIITNMEGKKLSKRDTSLKQFIENYKNEGYISEAIFNYLALLGWSHPNAKELLSREELIKDFDPNRLSKSPSKFDIKKMEWFSKEYMKKTSNDEIKKRLNFDKHVEEWTTLFIDTFKQSAVNYDALAKSLAIYNKPKNKISLVDNSEVISEFKKQLNKDVFTIDSIKEAIKQTQINTEKKGKDLFMPIRLATTGEEHGPELAKAIYLFGETIIKERLNEYKI